MSNSNDKDAIRLWLLINNAVRKALQGSEAAVLIVFRECGWTG